MAVLSSLPVRHKVYAYVICEGAVGPELLVFIHEDFSEAGVQVPGGTVEPGEDVAFAAEREVEEETGLKNLLLIRKLGGIRWDMRGLGL